MEQNTEAIANKLHEKDPRRNRWCREHTTTLQTSKLTNQAINSKSEVGEDQICSHVTDPSSNWMGGGCSAFSKQCSKNANNTSERRVVGIRVKRTHENSVSILHNRKDICNVQKRKVNKCQLKRKKLLFRIIQANIRRNSLQTVTASLWGYRQYCL